MRSLITYLAPLTLFVWFPLSAEISFGSRKAAIEVSSGSLAFTNDNISLNRGTLRTTGTGSFSNEAGDYLNCDDMRFETDNSTTSKTLGVDGLLYLDDATLTLEANDVLAVDGGQVAEAVTANGYSLTPSIIQGHGSFTSSIIVTSGRALAMRWSGLLNEDILLGKTSASSTILQLHEPLQFASGYGIGTTTASGTTRVYFNNHEMALGSVTIGLGDMVWHDVSLSLHGDVTIAPAIIFSGDPVHIRGNGHTLSVTGSTSGSVGGSISDITLGSYSNDVIKSSGTWDLSSVVFDDGSQKVRVFNGSIKGGVANLFAGNATWESPTHCELLTDITINGTWKFDAASTIVGNGNTITFADTDSTFDYDAALTITHAKLANVVAESFDNAGTQDLHLDNVEWRDDIGVGNGAIRICASPLVANARYAQISMPTTGTDGLLFNSASAVTWGNGASIDLLSNVDVSAGWIFNGKTQINGHGYAFNLNGGTLDYNDDLYLSDVALVGVAAGSFDNAASKDLYLTNVLWMDDASEGMLHIIGNTQASEQGAAQVSLATPNSGNIFSTAVTWNNGVNIELLRGITFSGSADWTFSENAYIQGNGNMMDLNSVATPISVAAGKTLSISNTVIVGWGNGEISLGAGAVLELSNVTIIMDNNHSTDLSSESIRVNGNTRIVTGTYIFDASTGSNQINGVTLWYDTVGRQDNTNVLFGSFTGGGRVVMHPLSQWQPLTFDNQTNYLADSMYLHYDLDAGGDNVIEALGTNITLDTSTAFTLQGGGRSLWLGAQPGSDATAAKLITVSGANTVELEDIVLVGWSENHISDASSKIRYGNGSVLRLLSDQTLTSDVYISNASSGDTVVLDLNGHTLDMDSDDAAFHFAATDVNFIIKNGRIINLNDNGAATKFIINGVNSTVIFQNVELVLNGGTRMLHNNVTFKGKCKITGTGDNTLSFYGTDITIAAGAHLKVDKGMTIQFEDTSPTISFGSASATLELFGATLDVTGLSSAPTLTTGRLLIDDKVTINGAMTLGGTGASDLDIVLQPASSLTLASGTITYSNDS